MQVRVFGPTRVVTEDGASVTSDFGGVKPRQILQVLALSAGAPVSKELLAELLWSGRPPRTYLATLESYVCLLRRSLGPFRHGGGLVTVRQGYLIDPDVLPVDLADFRRLVREGRAEEDPAHCLAHLELALGLVAGDLLAEESYAEWAVSAREELSAELVTVRTLAASCALLVGAPEGAVTHARAALAADPIAEGAWRTLMRALAAGGRRSEALRAYFEMRGHLSDLLGTDPSPESTDVYLDLLREESPERATAEQVEEIRLLVDLLRVAVRSVPGLDAVRAERAWTHLEEDLVEVAPRVRLRAPVSRRAPDVLRVV